MTFPLWQACRLFPAIANTFSVSGMFSYVKLRNEVAKFSQTFFKNSSLHELPRSFCDVNIYAATGWSVFDLIANVQKKGSELLDGSWKNCQFLAERVSIIFFGLATFYRDKPAFLKIGGHLDLLSDVLTLRLPFKRLAASDIEPKIEQPGSGGRVSYVCDAPKYHTATRLHRMNYNLKYGKVVFSIILKLVKLAASREGSRLASPRVQKVITAASLAYAVVDVSVRVFSEYTEHYKTKA